MARSSQTSQGNWRGAWNGGRSTGFLGEAPLANEFDDGYIYGYIVVDLFNYSLVYCFDYHVLNVGKLTADHVDHVDDVASFMKFEDFANDEHYTIKFDEVGN